MDEDTPAAGSVVYAISNGSMVKIGRTTNITNRLAALQHASGAPLELLGIMPGGGAAQEKMLHQIFAHRRGSGEWFDLSDTDVADLANLLYMPSKDELPKRTPKARRVAWEESTAPITIHQSALREISKRESLSITATYMLFLLLAFADMHDHAWVGRISTLGQECRTGTASARRTLDILATKELIEIVKPFDHYQVGEVRVLCYREVVIPIKRRAPRK